VHFPVEGSQTPSSWLDLSVGSVDLGSTFEIANADKLDKKISSLLSGNLTIGRYNETRAIYATGAYDVKMNDGTAWRTLHIGMDFFCSPATNVLAVLDGIVHSFANNNADRDYGPTIVLKHAVTDQLTFYTLYGHLGLESLKNLKVGNTVRAGDIIGKIGPRNENGNWTPHLHFQIILDMLGKEGDYPGVCTPEDASIWKSLCPDPWLLLTGCNSLPKDSIPKDKIISYRKTHVGKNLSISYKDPIKMVRGAAQFLIDDKGKRYLDTVNNVAHVGHEHPRVVAAGQRQMAVLNTNTRYLHENLVLFVEELLATMPSKLNVAFLVNSGSEANELAMRIAKNLHRSAGHDCITGRISWQYQRMY
jgi:murein DD-endopeptidase MepM/ murein hydrolase activator NlpD